jgi:hypothetical protein
MEIGESFSGPAPPVQEEEQKRYPCKWNDCKGKHSEDINPSYPSKGSTSKGAATSGANYEAEWIRAGLEPWVLRGPGLDRKPTAAEYGAELDLTKARNRNMVNKSVEEFSHPAYMTQKHHVVSVHLFDDFKKLAYDARLVDYNVNDKENGICLPYFIADIVRHDLQCHRGPHPPMYDERVSVLLRDLEQRCIHFCDVGMQPQVKQELEAIAQRVIRHIEQWRPGWYLRSNAPAERAQSFAQASRPETER